MNLEEKIMADIKAAMLAKDAKKLEALRAVKSAIQLEKTKGGSAGETLSGEDEIRLLQKLVKQRKESAEIYRTQGRVDLAEPEEFQYAVIEAFLPKQLDIEDVKIIVAAIIEKSGAQGIKDMGRVMGEASRQLAGKADNKTVAAIVKELLTGN
ncbi:MAG: GatB/YqeY domain-containing protein [Bacteroidales bacterium]|nr:GatB/YqeY domain-containing protein [Bacteroidales bacterium]